MNKLAVFIISSISNEDNKFVVFDKLNKMSVTSNKNAATRFPSSDKAWQALQNRIPKKRRDCWKIISVTQEVSAEKTQKRFKAVLDTETVVGNSFDWNTNVNNIKNSFSNILSYKDRLAKELTNVEAELCDCEHACEFFKCDAAHGYKLYKMIRERRIKRRFIKDELWRINSILGLSYSDITSGGIEKAFGEIKEQTYEPRVLKELFDDTSDTAAT